MQVGLFNKYVQGIPKLSEIRSKLKSQEKKKNACKLIKLYKKQKYPLKVLTSYSTNGIPREARFKPLEANLLMKLV